MYKRSTKESILSLQKYTNEKILEENGEWKLYKENKKVKDTNPEGSSVAVSSLWFTVGGEDLKDRAKSRKNTEDCLYRQRSSVTVFLLHLI